MIGIGAYVFVSGRDADKQEDVVEEKIEETKEDTETVEEDEDKEEPEEEPEEEEPVVITANLVDSPASVGEYSRLGVETATATSVVDQEGHDNSANMTLDSRDETSWQEGVDGTGIGESLLFQFDDECKVKYMSFKLGNWRNDDYYWQNNRPKTLEIRVGDTTSVLSFPDEKKEYWVEFSEACPTSEIQIEIQDVYRGTSSKWNDTCIAGIEIYGMAQ